MGPPAGSFLNDFRFFLTEVEDSGKLSVWLLFGDADLGLLGVGFEEGFWRWLLGLRCSSSSVDFTARPGCAVLVVLMVVWVCWWRCWVVLGVVVVEAMVWLVWVGLCLVLTCLLHYLLGCT